MALLFLDGCDHYDARAELADKWTHEDIVSVDTSGGRFGGGALLLATSDEVYMDIAGLTEVFAGVQFNVPTLPTGVEEVMVFGNAANAQISIQVAGFGGSIRVLRGTTEIDNSDGGLVKAGIWHTIEVRVVHNDTTGVVDVRLDGVQVINFSGDTIPASEVDIDRVEFRSPGGSGNGQLDDFYILDTNGGAPQNTFLGDWKIDTIFPDGDGNYTEFDTTFPASPTTHWDKVEETPTVDDASYNETPTANDRDTFTMGNLPAITAQTIFSVQQVSRAESSVTGGSTFQNMLRISGSDFNGATHTTTLSTFLYFREIWDNDPNASAAWTETVINGMESGVEHILTNTTRVSQHCVEVLRTNTAPLLRVSQFGVQVLRQADDPLLRVSQFAVQVLRSNLAPPAARLSQLSLEIARTEPASKARLTQISLNVARKFIPSAVVGLPSWMVFDDTHSFIVNWVAGDPPTSAADELAVLNGANAALLGSEILQFRDVVDLGGNQYSLSHLLRGRLGTEPFMNSHAIGETLVLLDAASVGRGVENTTDLNVQRYWKIVGAGLTLFGGPVTPFVNTGISQKPYQPVHITGSRDGSDNLTISWVRRTRIGGEWLDFIEVPLGEIDELYEVDILTGAGTVTASSPHESTSESVVYSIGDQTSDFGGAQNPVAVNVYQISNVVGRGYPGNALI